jgi:hypothetical protein
MDKAVPVAGLVPTDAIASAMSNVADALMSNERLEGEASAPDGERNGGRVRRPPRSMCTAAFRVSAASGCVRLRTSNCQELSRLGSTAIEKRPTERSGLSAIVVIVRGPMELFRVTAASAALEAFEVVIEKVAAGRPGM